MRGVFIATCLFLLSAPGLKAAGYTPIKERGWINLNENWKFILQKELEEETGPTKIGDDSDWETINIPHTWNAEDGVDDVPGYYRGIGWYRKHFAVDSSYKGRRILITFEAVNQVAEVWLNGTYLGKHIGGYTGFSFDITDCVYPSQAEDNLLVVKADNSYDYDIPPHSGDFNMYGGIYRDVRLLIVDPLHIVSTRVTTPEVSVTSAVVRVITEVKNDSEVVKDCKLVTEIVDAEGNVIDRMEEKSTIPADSTHQFIQTSGRINNPLLWSPAEPNLYSVYNTIYDGEKPVDNFKSPLGFRWVWFDPEKGVFLNGKSLKLKGTNRHQDYIGIGNALPNSQHFKDMEICQEMGCNFVRFGHYPQDPAVLDACDKLGLLVWEEIAVVNTVGGDAFTENAVSMLREMIKRDWNHPSIILWGLMNEALLRQPENKAKDVVALCELLNSTAHQQDPTRLTTIALCKYDLANRSGLADTTDLVGYNCYFGWYRGEFPDLGELLDKEHQSYPERKIILSEYGAGSVRGLHAEYPKRQDFSEEWQCMFHESHLQQITERPFIAGSCVWNQFDFGAEHRGDGIPHLNNKGMLDWSRQPKDVYYFYQSQWTTQPMVYIISHTWTKREESDIEVEVYTNCERVELFLNGKPLGVRAEEFRWDVELEAGSNILEAIGTKDSLTVTDTITIIY